VRLRSLSLLLFLSGLLVAPCAFAGEPSAAPVDLHTLVLDSAKSKGALLVPRTSALKKSRRLVFHFLGTPKFFVGIVVQSYDAKGNLLHHGLFDQGPIDEVLSRALFHQEERIQILGIFRTGHSQSSPKMVLRIRRFATGKTRNIPLDHALSLFVSRIGTKPDLVWAVR